MVGLERFHSIVHRGINVTSALDVTGSMVVWALLVAILASVRAAAADRTRRVVFLAHTLESARLPAPRLPACPRTPVPVWLEPVVDDRPRPVLVEPAEEAASCGCHRPIPAFSGAKHAESTLFLA